MSVFPLVSGCAVELEGYKVVVKVSVVKRKFARNGISWTFDMQYSYLMFIILFDANNPIINII